MVNLRYHIVSIVAVFLALGIGVFMGSSVIDSFTVEVLQTQQRNLEENLTRLDRDRRDLQREVDDLRARQARFEDDALPRLVEGRLDGVGVVVLAVEGLDGELVGQVEGLLTSAGAERSATVWLTHRFNLDQDDDRAAMASALGFSANLSGRVLRSVAVSRLAEALRATATAGNPLRPPEPPLPDAEPEGTSADPEDDILAVLEAAGFLRIERPEPVPGGAPPPITAAGTRLLVIGGGVRLDDLDVLRPLLAALSPVAGVGLVAATPTLEDADGGSIVELVRTAASLAARVSTVDNLGDASGRLATILALEDLEDGRVGHYGTRLDAERLVPGPRR